MSVKKIKKKQNKTNKKRKFRKITMESKKSYKADLENYRGTFLLVSLSAVLLVVYLIFTSSKKEIKIAELKDTRNVKIEEEMVQITRQELKTPPPQPQQQQISQDIIQIVKNDVKIVDVFNFDVNKNEDIEIDLSSPVDLPQEEEPEPVIFAEQMPEFPGGIEALKKFIAENIKYPQQAQENDIQGTVYLRFVVTSKGTVGEVQIIRGVHPLLDQEAVRVVKSLPKFKPGMQGGRAVPVWFSVPIVFQLSN